MGTHIHMGGVMSTELIEDGELPLSVGAASVTAAEFIEDGTVPLSVGTASVTSPVFAECVTLANLIPDPDFSLSGWGSGTPDTTHALYGTYGLKGTATASVAEMTYTTKASITLDSTHLYYGRLWTYQETEVGSCNIYWPIAEPSFTPTGCGAAGQWNMHSWRVARTSFTSGNYQLRLDFDNNYVAGSIWFDGVMLIDLTDCFGAGYEPSKAWCDTNIPFFSGYYELGEEEISWQN